MAKYKVLQDSVIGSGLVKAGEIIEYDGVSEGKPGANLELIPDTHQTFDTDTQKTEKTGAKQ